MNVSLQNVVVGIRITALGVKVLDKLNRMSARWRDARMDCARPIRYAALHINFGRDVATELMLQPFAKVMRMASTSSSGPRRLIVLLSLAVIACNSDVATVSPGSTPPKIAPLVTGDAANALQSNGQFAADPGDSPDGTPIISEGRARALAMAYVRAYGRTFHKAWEEQRGAPIDLTTLVVGPRIYFAHTPYGAFPSGFHPALRRSYGPYYLVTLLSNDAPVLVMAVSAYNTDVKTSSSGQLLLPSLGGMGFIHEGVPVDPGVYRLSTPEDAVADVAAASHARVSTRPRMVMRAHDTSPLLAVWQMDMERDVPIRDIAGDNARSVRTQFVSPRAKDRFLRADDAQPTPEMGEGPTITSDGKVGPVRHYEVPIAPGHAVKYKAIKILKEG